MSIPLNRPLHLSIYVRTKSVSESSRVNLEHIPDTTTVVEWNSLGPAFRPYDSRAQIGRSYEVETNTASLQEVDRVLEPHRLTASKLFNRSFIPDLDTVNDCQCTSHARFCAAEAQPLHATSQSPTIETEAESMISSLPADQRNGDKCPNQVTRRNGVGISCKAVRNPLCRSIECM